MQPVEVGTAVVVGIVTCGYILRRLLFTQPHSSSLTDGQRRLRAQVALAAMADSSPYNLHGHLSLMQADDGSIVLQMRLVPELRNFLGSLHGGAIASAIDVATTIAIVAHGGFPGVSTSLSVRYLNGCGPEEDVRIEPRVIRLGTTMAYTDCKIFRASDGVLMAHGSHVK